MKRKYSYQYYGQKKNRIMCYLLNKPQKNGFAGMIQSRIFKEPIALVASDEKMRELECCYAMLTVGEGMKVPRIIMDRNVFFDFKRNYERAKTFIFHEIGHYVNNDLLSYDESYYANRVEAAKKNDVMDMEERADLFACSFLGKDIVIQGLTELKNDIEEIGSEEDSLAIKELLIRIEKIKGLNYEQ